MARRLGGGLSYQAIGVCVVRRAGLPGDIDEFGCFTSHTAAGARPTEQHSIWPLIISVTEMSSILITGGCGFVGSNIALHLAASFADARIVCMDNLYRRGSEIRNSVTYCKDWESPFITVMCAYPQASPPKASMC